MPTLATSEKRRRAAERGTEGMCCGAVVCWRAVEGEPNSLRVRLRPWSMPERPVLEGGGVVVRDGDDEAVRSGGRDEEREGTESARGDPVRPAPSMAVAEECWGVLVCTEEEVDTFRLCAVKRVRPDRTIVGLSWNRRAHLGHFDPSPNKDPRYPRFMFGQEQDQAL